MNRPFTEADWERALAMPDAEFAEFLRAQRIFTAHPDLMDEARSEEYSRLQEEFFDALAGAGLVIPSIMDGGVKLYETALDHTDEFLAALAARAERQGLV